MKKLLILMLVLGLATVANAVVVQLSFNNETDGANGDLVGPDNTYTIPICTFFEIDVTSDTDNIAYDRLVRVYDVGDPYGPVDDVSGFTIENGVIYAEAGHDALFTVVAVPNTIQISAMAATEPYDVVAGKHFSWLLHCESESDVYVDLTDESMVVLDRILIHQIPEPATIALLGLGALALLRRRK